MKRGAPERSEHLDAQAAHAAEVLRAIAHHSRLLVLCHLAEEGELSAGELTRRVGLSQSALSQHLARMREEGLVETRKAAQSVLYRVADAKVLCLLSALRDIYCPAIVVAQPSGASQ